MTRGRRRLGSPKTLYFTKESPRYQQRGARHMGKKRVVDAGKFGTG
jgi:hypothetical protein